jgi:hypothetical protein
MRKGNKPWQLSKDGPDWTDISTMMQALGQLHSVSCTITFGPGVFDGPSMFITIAAVRMPREGSVTGEAVLALSVEWPCKDHTRVEDCVFAGLYELDRALTQKLWEQLPLPFTAT